MSENRFLQSFFALLASAILVSGTHLLLIASQDYGRPQLEPQAARPATRAPAAAPSAAREIDVEITGTTDGRSHFDATHFAGDQAPVSPAQATPAAEASAETTSSPTQTAEVDARSSDVAEAEAAAPIEQTKEKPIASAPEPAAPSAAPGEAPKPVEPVATAQTPAEPEPVEAPAAPPAQTAQTENENHVTSGAVAAEPEAQSTAKAAMVETADAEPVISHPPLPTRTPKLTIAKAVAPAAPPEAQEAANEQNLRWTPMALAPADKDIVAKPKLEPKRAESAGGYNAKIWSALARHKPRAGKAGSAVVTFAIGPGGGLRSAQISGSSGDSQLDQMALQTVRNAAPFPPPPDPASASYTIRIYFR